jgi:hypothetical protein
MIPEYPIDTRSYAEKEVFKLFPDALGTDDWIVLHSYNISPDKKSRQTEIDFVVLAPGLGIFGIEVKGGIVSCKGGKWYSRDRYEMEHDLGKGPFVQASNGIHKLMEYLEDRNWRVAFGYGVMFPDMNKFELTGTEGKSWQVFDKQDRNDVGSFIRRLSENWSRSNSKKPTPSDVKYIAKLLRPDIEPKLNDLISVAEGELIRLTEEQLGILNNLAGNDRILIEGSAGTGKTILAIEAAKRASKQGLKTAIFSYHTLISEWIKKKIESAGIKNIEVYSFQDFMLDHIFANKISLPLYKGEVFTRGFRERQKELSKTMDLHESDSYVESKDPNRDFWENAIPAAMMKALDVNPIRFDEIIVDESQDLIKGKYLEVFDRLLLGGLSESRWIFFADFDQDDIRKENSDAMRRIIKEKGHPCVYKLSKNCRNTIKIGNQIKTLMGHEFDCKFTDMACPDVRFESWSKKDEQADKLDKILRNLIHNGVKKQDIVILFAQNHLHPNEESLFFDNGKCKLSYIAPYDVNVKEESRGITYTSAGRFKGMESPVVILIDVDSYRENDEIRSLMYVGLSRARDYLIVLESEKAKKEREE